MINSVGFPIVVAAVLLYGLWCGGSFLASDILLPVSRKAIEFIQHLQVCQTRQVEATEAMCEQVAELSTTQQQHGLILDEIRDRVS